MAKKKPTPITGDLLKNFKGGFPVQPAKLPDPTQPDYGTYDPTLDQQERSASRGLADLLADLSKQGERGLADYGLSREDIARAQAQSQEDLAAQRSDYARSTGRSLADLLTARGRGQEDYSTSVQGVDRSQARGSEDYGTANEARGRNYQSLGNRQTQGAAKAGVATGGALAQALAKRDANRAIEQKAADTQFGRFNEDVGVQRQGLKTNLDRFLTDSSKNEGRIGEDSTIQGQRFDQQGNRINEAAGRSQGSLALQLGRSFEDMGTQGTRAERENTIYGQDLNEVRVDQAKQSGLLPDPVAPQVVKRPSPKPAAQPIAGVNLTKLRKSLTGR